MRNLWVLIVVFGIGGYTVYPVFTTVIDTVVSLVHTLANGGL